MTQPKLRRCHTTWPQEPVRVKTSPTLHLMTKSPILLLCLSVFVFAGRPADNLRAESGPHSRVAPHLSASPRHGPRKGIDTVRRWNEIAINASGLDHTPVAP